MRQDRIRYSERSEEVRLKDLARLANTRFFQTSNYGNRGIVHKGVDSTGLLQNISNGMRDRLIATNVEFYGRKVGSLWGS